ncbi:MAG TPA: hypothetical protein DCY88_28010 [Cyanobacteria bacterium UBA11372]|nr:hypothetical protein [Cyanobacteria bacterium UBA11372]
MAACWRHIAAIYFRQILPYIFLAYPARLPPKLLTKPSKYIEKSLTAFFFFWYDEFDEEELSCNNKIVNISIMKMIRQKSKIVNTFALSSALKLAIKQSQI